jgi:hypothetical protein
MLGKRGCVHWLGYVHGSMGTMSGEVGMMWGRSGGD